MIVRRFGAPLFAICAAASLAACGSDAVTTPTPAPATAVACPSTTPAPTGSNPAATADSFSDSVTLTTLPDGLQYGDLSAGTGPVVAKGQNLTVQYTGWLTNGTLFDSSRKAGGSPFSFVIGNGAVIPGWDEGLLTMHVGGKRRLVIPPSLGYGASGSGPIPANATLVFEVELLAAAAPCPSP